MVEGRRQERHRIVTVRAVRGGKRRARRRMHRIICPLPATAIVRIQMTLRVSAVGRLDLQIVVVVDVAVAAGCHLPCRRQLVRVGQRKACCSVIKIRILPGNRVVAVGTSRNRKHCWRGGVLRIRRLLPRGEVAARIPAVGCSNLQIVVATYVTTCTGNIGMTVRQREADRGSRVVYGSSEPTVERVAGLARLRELRADVIRHAPTDRLRAVQVGLVAGNASCGQPLELTDSRALVAIITLQRRVGSQQREAVLVVLHLLHGDVPTLYRVTLRAIRAHLALVHVGVAVFAILGHVGENRFDVALHALHFFVHSTQRIFRFIVVEFRNGLDRPPCRGRVAVLARDRERAVRTTSCLPLRRGNWSVGWLQGKEQEPAQKLKERVRNCPLNIQLPSIRLRGPGVQSSKNGLILSPRRGAHNCTTGQFWVSRGGHF